MEHRKYESIVRIEKVSKQFNKDMDIIISEKIDGANASFELANGELHIFSRNNYIPCPETFRGFRDWLIGNIDLKSIKEGFRYYGEWIVRHKIKYNIETENTFVLFDVYDKNKNIYVDYESICLVANELNIKTPELFYRGKFQSIEHLKQFVGKSNITEDGKGEGIVVKSEDRDFMCKYVRDDFQETKMTKSVKEVNFANIELFEKLCTVARVEKVLHKGVDDGFYNEISLANMGSVLKFTIPEIITNLGSEDKQYLPSDMDSFIKIIKGKVPSIVRGIINNK